MSSSGSGVIPAASIALSSDVQARIFKELVERGFGAYPAPAGLDAEFQSLHEASRLALPLLETHSAIRSNAAAEAVMDQVEGLKEVNDARATLVFRSGSAFLQKQTNSGVQGYLRKVGAVARSLGPMTAHFLSCLPSTADTVGQPGLLCAQAVMGLHGGSGGGPDGLSSASSFTVQSYKLNAASIKEAEVAPHTDCTLLTAVAIQAGDRALQLQSRTKKAEWVTAGDLVPAGSHKWVIVVFAGHLFDVAMGKGDGALAVTHRVVFDDGAKQGQAGAGGARGASVGQKRGRKRYEDQDEQRISFVFRLLPHMKAELNLKRAIASGCSSALSTFVSPSFGPSIACRSVVTSFRKKMPSRP